MLTLFVFQERKKEGDRWKVNNAGETMNGDDDEFDPNMRYATYIIYFIFSHSFLYGLSYYSSYETVVKIRMECVLFILIIV